MEQFKGSENGYRTEKVLTSEWDMLIKNNEGEAEIHRLQKYEYQGNPEQMKELLKPNEEEIRFRKRKIGEKAMRTYFIFGDSHIGYRDNGQELLPTHDERNLELASQIAYDINPDYVINLGDTLDLANLGRYEPDSSHFFNTTQHSIDRAYAFEKAMREATPNAEYYELEGNHDARFKRMVAKNGRQLLGLKQAGGTDEEVLSYEHFMNLKSLDINYVSGYPAGQMMINNDMVFRHGSDLRSNGSTAELLSKRYPYHSVIQGHGHKLQLHQKTTPDGRTLLYYMNPILGRTDGIIPGYGTAVDNHNQPVQKQEDWQQGITILNSYGNGVYEIKPVNFYDGKAFIDGKKYEATRSVQTKQ